MADEIVFYTNPMSRGRMVRWMLEELGEPYRTELLAFGPEMKSPDYLAINPMGKVPALRHGSAIVTECPAILAYLADAFPEAGLAPPPGDPARGAYLRWLFFAAGPLEAAVTDRSLGLKPAVEQQGRIGYGSCEQVLDVVEHAVARGPHVAGDRFSAADLYLSSHIGWGMLTGGIDKRPTFQRYVEWHIRRPAALKARAIDDALMARKH